MSRAKLKVVKLTRAKSKKKGAVDPTRTNASVSTSTPQRSHKKPLPATNIAAILESWSIRVLELFRTSALAEERIHFGKLQQQLSFLSNPQMLQWIHSLSSRLPVSLELISAALVTADITKFRPQETQEATHRAQLNDLLPYGAVFKSYSMIENLYMHAAAAEFFALTKFKAHCMREGMRAPEATALSEQLRDTIRGHDSYLAGFEGPGILSALKQKYSRSFDYPRSLTLNGYIVQLLDKLPFVETAHNAGYANIIADAETTLSSAQLRVLKSCPALPYMERGAFAPLP